MFLCLRVVRIAVGMVLHRQLAISFFYVFFRCIAVDAEHFVVVFFCHIPGLSAWRLVGHEKLQAWNIAFQARSQLKFTLFHPSLQ
jgi:hypothetical protein